MHTVKFAVLGMGRWGKQWQSVISGFEGAAVVATASRRPGTEVLPAHSETFPATHYRDYGEAIADSEADAVVITLPVHLHADAIVRALESGKHVLCEKPLVGTEAELARVIETASRFPALRVMVGQNYRRRPWAQATRQLISSGAVGQLGRVSLRFSQPEFLAGGRREMEAPLLDDMSIHHFDLLRFLTGRDASEIYVHQYAPPWSAYLGAPALEAVIAFEGGVVANYSGSWASRGFATSYDGDYLLEGDLGAISVGDNRILLDIPGRSDPPSVEYVISEQEQHDT